MDKIPSIVPNSKELLDTLPSEVNRVIDPENINTSNKKLVELLYDNRIDHHELMKTFKSNHEFENPYLLKNIAQYFGINETGSNYPNSSFDPSVYSRNDFIENIRIQYRIGQPVTESELKRKYNKSSYQNGNTKAKQSRWDT